MTFQFQCPQGHLLEGEESQAGQQCTCPTCGMLFLIPAPAPSMFSEPAAQPDAGFPNVAVGGPSQGGGEMFPNVTGGGGATNPLEKRVDQPTLYHIPCPNGHELETPPEMFGQDVMCPHCGAQFQLREKDSVEFKRRRVEERERRDQKAGKLWLNWSIVIAVLVVIGLILMIAMGQ